VFWLYAAVRHGIWPPLTINSVSRRGIVRFFGYIFEIQTAFPQLIPFKRHADVTRLASPRRRVR
jgi:hypothetical protein